MCLITLFKCKHNKIAHEFDTSCGQDSPDYEGFDEDELCLECSNKWKKSINEG